MNQTPSEVLPGLVILDKPSGLTSHDCVSRIRRLAGTKKVGHAGTLDPLATGVLVLGVGRATRFLAYMVGLGKTYAATVRLGQSTTTDDALGAVIATTPAAGLTPEQVEMALAPLRGEISQVPSAVSAIKVDGRRAYARVRAGETVELKPRLVTVSRLEITARRVVGEFTDLDLVVECSSGTYVRALARDLGQNLAVGGHLTALRRLAVGPFLVAGAFTLEQLEADFRVLDLGAAARLLFPVRELVPEQVEALRHGRFVAAGAPGLAAALAPDGALVAMVRSDTSTGQARPEAVFV